jgi:NADH-quinone oxidoreductase subunit L
MGRALFLTFFGEYRGHGHPHESPPSMTVPLLLLAVPSVFAGLLNAPGVEKFGHWVRFEVAGSGFELPHHELDPGLAVFSVAVAVAGGLVATWIWYWQKAPRGVLQRNPALRAGHTFLVEKYYLDRIFVDGLVGFIKGPLARAVYWVNQNVIDGVVNGIGAGARLAARFTYDVVDQKVVDGAVNGIGASASETGALLRMVQSGRVQQYALMLFGAVGLLGLLLAVVN